MLFNVTQLNFSHLHAAVVPEVFRACACAAKRGGGRDTCYVAATTKTATTTTIIKCQQLFSNFQTFHFILRSFFVAFKFFDVFFSGFLLVLLLAVVVLLFLSSDAA